MNGKERVLCAINHEQPDRVPVCATFVPEVQEKLRQAYSVPDSEDLGAYLGHDLVKISSGLENSFYREPTGDYVCPYGITWRNARNSSGRYTEIASHPLAGEEIDLDQYPLPLAANDQHVISSTKEAIKKYGHDKWIIGSCQCTLFEAAWYLRGLEQFMVDMLIDEDFTHDLLDKLMAYPCQIGHFFIDAGVDMLWLGDDIATQRNMMISPELWRKYLKPRYARMFADFRSHRKDIRICYHSCGNLEEVIPELIEIGLDVLNPIQPLAMDPLRIKQLYGDKLTLYGGLDIQQIMPRGTVSQVKNEVKRLIEGCGRNGGFILSPAHHIQADTPLENIRAFYEAAYGY